MCQKESQKDSQTIPKQTQKSQWRHLTISFTITVRDSGFLFIRLWTSDLAVWTWNLDSSSKAVYTYIYVSIYIYILYIYIYIERERELEIFTVRNMGQNNMKSVGMGGPGRFPDRSGGWSGGWRAGWLGGWGRDDEARLWLDESSSMYTYMYICMHVCVYV